MACGFSPVATAGKVLVGTNILNDVPITMFSWFNPESLHDGVIGCINQGGDFSGYRFELRADGKVKGFEFGAVLDPQSDFVAGNYTPNNWQTGAVVFINHTDKIAYYNGVAGTPYSEFSHTPVVEETAIGGRRLSAEVVFRPLHGCLAHFAVWNTVLNANDMARLSDGFHLPTDIKPENLVLYVPLFNVATEATTLAWDSGSGRFIPGITLTEHGGGTIVTCGSSPTIVAAGARRRWLNVSGGMR